MSKILTWNKNNELINSRKLSFLNIENNFRNKNEVHKIFNKIIIENLRSKITIATAEKKNILYKFSLLKTIQKLKGFPAKVDAIILLKLMVVVFLPSLLIKKEISDLVIRSKTFSNS